MLRAGCRPSTAGRWALALLPLLIASPVRSETGTGAYVVHGGAGLATAIDTATGTAAGTIAVGARPTRVAVSRDGARAYVANTESDSISVIDTTSDTLADTLLVGDSPTALAVTPDGRWLYVLTSGGVVQVVDPASHAVAASLSLGTGDGGGEIAITPDGGRAYVASGLVHVIDTATNAVVSSFVAAEAAVPDVTHHASSVAISPDGTRAYVGVVTFSFAGGGFGAGGHIAVVDTASESVVGTVDLFSLPGSIALTPDGSRAYVVIQSTFVNTGYGMGFFPGRHLVVIDTLTNGIAGVLDLGAGGPNWTQQNTAAGIGVTPDRSAVYVVIPRLGVVAVADVNTNAVAAHVPVAAGPGHLAIVPDDTATPVPYRVDAADDQGTVSTDGGAAVANVLANDRLGGFPADMAHVTLARVSSTSDGVAVDPATGAVGVAAGTALGVHTLVYRICETAAASNCDEATVTVTVRAVLAIDAVNDSAVSLPGRPALASVLANDTLDGTPATTGRVALSVASTTSTGILLNAATGSVFVLVGTTPGPHTLTYRICEIASPANCDTADVALTVNPFPIDAVNDAGTAPRSGGAALANVLANDTFAGAVATLAQVRLSQVASSHPAILLDVASGAVTVGAGTPVGAYILDYRICEIATPANCDQATVTVTVLPLTIVAVNDSARGSSKVANTVLASVLTNDRLGGAPAHTANVRLALVSLTPANSKIRLDLADGSVDVLGKTDSGLHALRYEICETAMPTNCARATANIDLSGR
jgi:YVTN family beta-propeller protein